MLRSPCRRADPTRVTDLELPVEYVRRCGLPRICARTGEETTRTYRRTVYLRRWWIWLGLLAGLLIVILLQHLCCDPLHVRVPVDRALARRRTLLAWASIPAGLVGFTLVLWGLTEPSPVSGLAAVAGVAGVVLPLALRARTNTKVTRDEDMVRLHGVHPALAHAAREHLASLTRPAPAWHPDPSGQPQYRWWDGGRWTEHVRAYA